MSYHADELKSDSSLTSLIAAIAGELPRSGNTVIFGRRSPPLPAKLSTERIERNRSAKCHGPTALQWRQCEHQSPFHFQIANPLQGSRCSGCYGMGDIDVFTIECVHPLGQ